MLTIVKCPLGMAIKGGSDTPYKNVYVRELREGGAVHKDGFVQVQSAVCQVLSPICF